MNTEHFSNVTSWVFDLDNTLYPPQARLFDQIEVRMTTWVMRELGLDRPAANHLRKQYWAQYGTTLAGLMREHDVDPAPYLHEVHEIDLGHIEPDEALAARIAALPGRRIVFTNGTRPYAERIIAARGLDTVFDAVYGVENARFLPKPERAAFETVFATDGLDPSTAAMFEDEPRNLAVPHEMGMRTVHVAPKSVQEPFIHYHTDDLARFLGQVTQN